MPVLDVALDDAASGTLDDNGDALIRIGPPHPGVMWTVTTAAVSTNSNERIPNCRLYRDAVNESHFLGGTVNGSQDSTELNEVLHHGNALYAHFTGGDPGRIATLSVFGTMRVGHR